MDNLSLTALIRFGFMILFFSASFFLLHIYPWKKLNKAFSIPVLYKKALLLSIFLGYIFVIIVMSNNTPSIWFTIFSHVIYSWITFLFIFTVCLAVYDVFRYLSKRKVSSKISFFIPLTISAAIILYAGYEAADIKVETLEITTNKLPENIKKLRIALISDIHFSQVAGVSKAEDVRDIVNSLNADVLLFSGDFLDRGIREPEKIKEIMSSIKMPLGKYAVTGNHEFYVGEKEAVKFIKDSGFTLIRNKALKVGDLLNIVGIDDESLENTGKSLPDEKSLFNNIDKSLFTIYMKHRPNVTDDIVDKFDLMLSGHTHGGQVFPFTLFVKMAFPHLAGKYNLKDGKILYVSRGTGEWGPQLRFMSPPEITLIEINSL